MSDILTLEAIWVPAVIRRQELRLSDFSDELLLIGVIRVIQGDDE